MIGSAQADCKTYVETQNFMSRCRIKIILFSYTKVSIFMLKKKVQQLLSHSGIKLYTNNMSWFFLYKFISMALGLAVSIWIVRYLGPTNYGILSYAVSFVGLFAPFLHMGLANILTRELVKKEQQSAVIMGSAFAVTVFLGIAVPLVIIIIAYYQQSNYLTFIVITIIAVSKMFAFSVVFSWYFRAKLLAKYTVLANLVSLLVVNIFRIGLLIYQAPFIYFIWSFLIEVIVAVSALLFFYQKSQKLSIFSWSFKLPVTKKLLRDALPFLFAGLAMTIYMQIDQVMIHSMLGAKEVGYYAASVRITDAINALLIIVPTVLFPAIVKAREIGKELYMLRLLRLYCFGIWTTIVIALLLSVSAPSIINLLIGEEFTRSIAVLQIHAWSSIFMVLLYCSGNWYVAENFALQDFTRQVVAALFNIALNLYLIPIYGIEGAALATLLSLFIASYLADAFMPKTRGQFILKTKAFLCMGLIAKKR